jgi:ABC-2 type transport system permease protein
MVATWRLIGVGGVIAYRALFNWATPPMFVGTLLAQPITQLLFFVYLGRQLEVADDRFFTVGNAVLVASIVGVYGGTMSVGNERRYATLSSVLLSPRNRAAIFVGRALPYAGNGLLVAAFTLAVGSVLVGVRLPVEVLPGLALALLAGSVSCAFFGLTLGSIGLRLRDVWMVSNSAHILLLLVTGVNVPRDGLPEWLQAVGSVVPVTHAAEAARQIAAGKGLVGALPQLGMEVAVGTGYALLAMLLLTVFETEGRRSGTLDIP